MKPRRPTAILLLFVAALATWLTIRPHPAPPTPAGDVPPPSDGSVQPAPPMPMVAVPAPTASGGTPVVDAALPTPTVPGSSPAAASSSPPQPTTATPNTLDPQADRSDAPSINAIQVRRMVTDYHTLTGENPVGTNAEIMAAIMGKNPRQAVLGPPEGFELNAQGELLDQWGTPYFFHQLSRDLMEIHSAGPDKIMGTADDIVVR